MAANITGGSAAKPNGAAFLLIIKPMIELDVQPRRKGIDAPEPDQPFRILVLGDFGAATNKPIFIDRDNFDQVLGKLAPSVDLPVFGQMRFRELDDFHPDRLYQRLEVFKTLRDTRDKLEDPDTFQETAAKLQAPPPPPRPSAPPQDLLNAGSLLDAVLEESESAAPARSAAKSDPFHNYLQSIVGPYLVPKANPKLKELVAELDAAISGQMSNLLHDAAFQALEAAWRGLYFLVRNIDTDVNLKLYFYHLPKETLAREVIGTSDLRTSSAYQILVAQTVGTPGAHRWSVVAGNYTFGQSNADIELLGRLSLLASTAQAPFLAAATPSPEAWLKPRPEWMELISIPEASWIGLALPRFLLRMPYGKKSDALESFDYEEAPGKPQHEHYLWGNPVFACVRLLGEAFSADGWSMEPGLVLDIDGIPAHVYRDDDGDSTMQPCAEFLMLQNVAQALMEKGFMPLLSMKNSDRIRLAGFRAINGDSIAGAWS